MDASEIRHAENADIELIRQTKAGDVAAFERLFQKYQKRVYNLIYRMVGNEQDASDLTQDTFVRVYNSLTLLKTEEAFYTWVRKVATNIVRDHFRKAGRTIKADSLDQTINLEDGEVERQIEDWSGNPERNLNKQILQETIQRSVDSLTEDHRVAIVLHHIEGMDVKEIADMLNLPEGTIKSRLARARQELKRKLGHLIS